jgi:hypothetical protein
MDKAHLSRVVSRLRSRRLLRCQTSPEHRKHRLLSLTKSGHDAFTRVDQGTRAQIEGLLALLDSQGQKRLVAAMQEIKSVLGGASPRPGQAHLRDLEPGDLGWIAHRQAVLYHREYGFDWTL